MRQLAWLNAVPQPPKSAKTTDEPNTMTRLQQIQQAGQEPALPPPGLAAHLVDHLLDVGPVLSAGMGLAPVSYAELAAWQDLIGVPLQPWEARGIRRLSRVYLEQAEASRAHDCPPPWLPSATQAERADQVGGKLRSILGARARREAH